MNKDQFTWYNRKLKYTEEEMVSKYKVMTMLLNCSFLDEFIDQVYKAGYTAGRDSMDNSWAGVK